MAIQDGDTLKSYFALGKVPTPSQYGDLVDTIMVGGGGQAGNYVRLLFDDTISATHTFDPSFAGPPFILGENAQGQLVTGLNADKLDGLESSFNPGVSSKILASDASGQLTIEKLFLGFSQDTNLYRNAANSLKTDDHLVAGQSIWTYEDIYIMSAGKVLYFGDGAGTYDTDLYRDGANCLATHDYFWVNNQGAWIDHGLGVGYVESDFTPNTNYLYNLGSISKKYLALHAAELWVETLVAANTMATIGGHILVGPTDKLVSDIGLPSNNLNNPGFESGMTGWDLFQEGSGSIYVEDAPYNRSGTYCATIYNGTSGFTRFEQQVSITSGQIFTLSFWCRGHLGHDGCYYIWDVTNSVYLLGPLRTDNHNDTYTRIMVSIYIAPGTASINVGFGGDMDNWESYCFFDDISFGVDAFSTVYNQMQPGDIVRMEAAGKVEWIKILGGPYASGDHYNYYIERDIDWTGGNEWYAGDAIFNTGKAPSGNNVDGFIDLYSVNSTFAAYGPTIAGYVRFANDWHWQVHEAWAIGNLNGLYGYSENIFGVMLGEYSAGNQIIEIDKYGIWMGSYNGSSSWTPKIVIGSNGVITIGEVASAVNNIEINSSQIIFRTWNTERIKMHADGGITINDVNGVAQITFDSSGNAIFGKIGANLANILWNATNHRLEFRTEYSVKSYIDTDGSFVVNTTQDFWARAEAITWSNGSADIATLGAYDSASLQGVELKTIGVAGKAANAYLKGIALSTNAAGVSMVAQNASYDGHLTISAGTSNATGEFTLDKLVVGSSSRLAEFWITGNLTRWLSSGLTYVGYIYVPLTTPLTSTSWDGDPRSTTAKTLIDLSAVFGVPAGVKAVLVRIGLRDSGSATNDTYIVLSPNNTAGQGMFWRVHGIGNDGIHDQTQIVNCDTNGDIYYQIAASGVDTLDVWMEIWGYYI